MDYTVQAFSFTVFCLSSFVSEDGHASSIDQGHNTVPAPFIISKVTSVFIRLWGKKKKKKAQLLFSPLSSTTSYFGGEGPGSSEASKEFSAPAFKTCVHIFSPEQLEPGSRGTVLQ